MPPAWLLHVLEERLRREFGDACTVRSVALRDLTPAELKPALAGLLALPGALPVVMVDGFVACAGTIDLDAILAAVTVRL